MPDVLRTWMVFLFLECLGVILCSTALLHCSVCAIYICCKMWFLSCCVALCYTSVVVLFADGVATVRRISTRLFFLNIFLNIVLVITSFILIRTSFAHSGVPISSLGRCHIPPPPLPPILWTFRWELIMNFNSIRIGCGYFFL